MSEVFWTKSIQYHFLNGQSELWMEEDLFGQGIHFKKEGHPNSIFIPTRKIEDSILKLQQQVLSGNTQFMIVVDISQKSMYINEEEGYWMLAILKSALKALNKDSMQ